MEWILLLYPFEQLPLLNKGEPMKLFTLIASLLLVTTSVYGKETFCKDNGQAEFNLLNNEIVINLRGLGERDGSLNFTKVKSHPLSVEEAKVLSEDLNVPIESGNYFTAVLGAGGSNINATILKIITEVDKQGIKHKALLLSLNNSDAPSLLGFDTLCKKQ